MPAAAKPRAKRRAKKKPLPKAYPPPRDPPPMPGTQPRNAPELRKPPPLPKPQPLRPMLFDSAAQHDAWAKYATPQELYAQVMAAQIAFVALRKEAHDAHRAHYRITRYLQRAKGGTQK